MKGWAARVLAGIVPVVSWAQVLAGWDVAGINLGEFQAPYTLGCHVGDPRVHAATLSLSPHVQASTANNTYGFSIPVAQQTASLAEAIAAGHYIEIAVTAAPDHVFTLASMSIKGESTATGCDDVAILSDVDGFDAAQAIAWVGGVAGKTGGFDTDDSGFGGPIDLGASKYAGLASIVIRIYGWNSSGSTGSTRLRNLSGADLVVYGTVAYVPPQGTTVIIR